MADLLVVDDDMDVADLLAAMLVAEGHAVRIARNGEEGLVMLSERRPDLVILDVEMPELDGPGMAYGMFVHDVGLEKVPIVLASGVADLDRVAARVGTPYYVGKPFRPDRLMAALERALVERHAPVRTSSSRSGG